MALTRFAVAPCDRLRSVGVMRSLFLLTALLAASPAGAAQLTVPMGETLMFRLERGQPTHARKANPATKPRPGEIRVSVRSMMGTTMTMTNNSRFDYAYRATLVMPSGKLGAAKACAVPANGRVAIEQWTRPIAAVRLDHFKRAPAGSLCP